MQQEVMLVSRAIAAHLQCTVLKKVESAKNSNVTGKVLNLGDFCMIAGFEEVFCKSLTPLQG